MLKAGCGFLNGTHGVALYLPAWERLSVWERGTACRGLPCHRVPVRRTLLCAPPRAPGASINDACIIEPFMIREQVKNELEAALGRQI